MAKDHGPSVKDDEQYGKLRKKGENKEKAARIANTNGEGGEARQHRSLKGRQARRQVGQL
jgi:hypothetical protein